LETADETAKIGADCFVFERIMPVSSHAVRS
jgi:hypothetical protein